MWRKDEQRPAGSEVPTSPASSSHTPSSSFGGSSPSQSTPASAPVSSKAAACISQGIRIKGEITGSEDLFIDGQLDGKLDLGNASVTVGPNGRVKADIQAREVVVRGQVDGKVLAKERTQIWNTGQVAGEVQTERIAIEDGGVLRGKVEAGKSKSSKTESRETSTPANGKSKESLAVGSGSAAD